MWQLENLNYTCGLHFIDSTALPSRSCWYKLPATSILHPTSNSFLSQPVPFSPNSNNSSPPLASSSQWSNPQKPSFLICLRSYGPVPPSHQLYSPSKNLLRINPTLRLFHTSTRAVKVNMATAHNHITLTSLTKVNAYAAWQSYYN